MTQRCCVGSSGDPLCNNFAGAAELTVATTAVLLTVFMTVKNWLM